MFSIAANLAASDGWPPSSGWITSAEVPTGMGALATS
jgi:hypothetical protein